MRSVILIISFFVSQLAFGQEYITESAPDGEIVVYQDSRIDSLIQQHIAVNQKYPGIDGYRIMIFFDSGNNSKDTAYRVMMEFSELYPDVPAYLSFNPPYYRVRVGNFRTRLEAEKFLYALRRDYPNGWVVETTIELPKLD